MERGGEEEDSAWEEEEEENDSSCVDLPPSISVRMSQHSEILRNLVMLCGEMDLRRRSRCLELMRHRIVVRKGMRCAYCLPYLPLDLRKDDG